MDRAEERYFLDSPLIVSEHMRTNKQKNYVLLMGFLPGLWIDHILSACSQNSPIYDILWKIKHDMAFKILAWTSQTMNISK